MRQEPPVLGGQSPLTRISREGIATTHRFYDSSPLSPSGEYVALTEFPYENKLPSTGDAARVVVRSVSTGEEIFGSETIAWDTQLGAQAQWGATDEQLVFNRMDKSEWNPYGVLVNPFTGTERRLGGSVYMVDRSGEFAVSPNLKRMKWAQPGYGVHVPEAFMDSRVGIPRDDGVFRIDLVTGVRTLLVSLDDIVKAFPEQFSDLDPLSGGLIGFHTKLTHDGKRIMFLVRWLPKNARPNHTRNWIITMATDGSDLAIALDAARWAGGHHPNWQPDGEKIIMNLVFNRPTAPWLRPRIFLNKVLRRLGFRARFNVGQLGLAQFDHRGAQFSRVAGERMGSGHPSVLNDGSILTDAYPTEPVAAGDGTVPIRLISVDGTTEAILAKFRTQPDFNGPAGEWRVDPHPAVDRDQKRFVVNSYADGYRAVYLGDLPGRSAATTGSTSN